MDILNHKYSARFVQNIEVRPIKAKILLAEKLQVKSRIYAIPTHIWTLLHRIFMSNTQARCVVMLAFFVVLVF